MLVKNVITKSFKTTQTSDSSGITMVGHATKTVLTEWTWFSHSFWPNMAPEFFPFVIYSMCVYHLYIIYIYIIVYEFIHYLYIIIYYIIDINCNEFMCTCADIQWFWKKDEKGVCHSYYAAMIEHRSASCQKSDSYARLSTDHFSHTPLPVVNCKLLELLSAAVLIFCSGNWRCFDFSIFSFEKSRRTKAMMFLRISRSVPKGPREDGRTTQDHEGFRFLAVMILMMFTKITT